MTNLNLTEKPCNRWPGHSRCLKSVQDSACTAEVEENGSGYDVKCVSRQKRKGVVPVELILISRGIIMPEKESNECVSAFEGD